MRQNEFTDENLAAFREAYSEVHDFARCQRPDGTFYGTSGVCRKGSQVGAKERPEKKGRKKAKAEKPKVEAPKKPTDYARGGTLKKDVPGPVAKAGTDKKIYQDQIAKANEYLKKDPDDEFAALMKQRAEKNLQPIVNSENLVEGIVKDVPAGTKVGFKSNGFLGTEFTTPGGTKVTTSFGQGDFNFQVNGKYDAGQVTDRKEQMAIARQVQRVWNAHRQNLPEGYVVMATAWGEDGRGASRIRAYERMGFSGIKSGTPKNPGTQYGRVEKGGKIVPADRAEQGQGSTLLMFAEKGLGKDLGLWYVAIFGVPEKKDDFSETDTLDFARCQRADGTFYGTSGTCRQGTKVGPREMKALKKAAAGGNARAAAALQVVEGKRTVQQAKAELGASPKKEMATKKKVEPQAAPAPKAAAKEGPATPKKEGYAPKEKKAKEDMGIRERISDKLTRMKNEGKLQAEIGFQNEAQIKQSVWNQMSKARARGDDQEVERLKRLRQARVDQMKANKEFAARLEKEVPAGTKLTVNDWGEAVMSTKVGRHTIEATYSPTRGFNYQVDGKYDTGSISSRRQQMQTALKVRSMWDATVRSLPVGSVISTSAYDGDGEKATNARIKAYKRLGFSDPTTRVQGRMFAVKTPDGRMVSSNKEDYEAQRYNSDSVFFEEAEETQERRMTQADELSAWYGILFPWEEL